MVLMVCPMSPAAQQDNMQLVVPCGPLQRVELGGHGVASGHAADKQTGLQSAPMTAILKPVSSPTSCNVLKLKVLVLHTRFVAV